MKILVVEDEELLAELLETELTEAGYHVVGPVDTSANAEAAILLNCPDLALVNIDLRDGSTGTDVAIFLTQKCNVPCLFISGREDDARKHRNFALGMVTKPYRIETILASIEVARAIMAGREPPTVPTDLELFHRSGQPQDWNTREEAD